MREVQRLNPLEARMPLGIVWTRIESIVRVLFYLAGSALMLVLTVAIVRHAFVIPLNDLSRITLFH